MKKLMTIGLVLAAACAVCGALAEEEPNATFSTPGPDKYADGTSVLVGECYALVWTKDEKTEFPGVTWDFKAADTNIAEVVKVLAQADYNSACPTTVVTGAHSDGKYEVVLLDTRVPKANNVLSGLENEKPVLVSAWTIIENGTGAQEGWHTVKIAAKGVSFPFDVSSNVAEGYAVVSPAEGVWSVYPLPTAYTKIVEPGVVSSLEGYAMLIEPEAGALTDPFTLDVTYKFDAYTPNVAKVVNAITNELIQGGHVDEWGGADFKDFDAVGTATQNAFLRGDITLAEATEAGEFLQAVYPFWDWNCDFEISFDQGVDAKSFVLAGRYEQADKFSSGQKSFKGWVCSCHDEDLAAGEPMRLLEGNSYKPEEIYVSYYEICSRVQEFLCGVKNLSKKNWGKTITVKLNMYENTGRCDESGYKATVGTYKFRFEGPLKINYNQGELPEGVTITEWPENYDGNGFAVAKQLPVPAYTSTDDKMMFAGWTTNGVTVTAIPANFFSEEPIEVTAAWTPCQKVKVEDKTLDIKVDDEWVKENVGEEATTDQIEDKLNEEDENGNKKWVNYVLNQDAKTAIQVTDTKTGDETTIPIVSNLEAPKTGAGFNVQYSIDKVEDEGGVTKVILEGEPQDTSDLIIDLNDENNADPTGYYKMNVLVTPEEDPTTTKVVAESTIGVLKIESAQSPMIVAVPWTELEDTNDVTVAKVIKTSTLSEADVLHIYNKTTEPHFYYAWEVKNNAWSPIYVWNEDTGIELSPDPTKWNIPRGVGMWLERQDVSKPFYLSGLYNTNRVATTQIEAGTTAEPAYNLIAPPRIEPTDINEIVSLKDEALTNDQIMVVGGTVPKAFNYAPSNPADPTSPKSWGYTKTVYVKVGNRMRAKTIRVTDDSVIPAGTGAWYVSGGGDPLIKWGKPSDDAE